MNANEIRIGNWVNLEFVGPFQWEYTHFEEYVKDSKRGWDVQGCIISDKIEPILLTAEIFEEAGFIKGAGETRTWKWKDYNFHITKDGFVYTDSWYKQNFIPVRYVHQLQNLYFALTGEELNIEL